MMVPVQYIPVYFSRRIYTLIEGYYYNLFFDLFTKFLRIVPDSFI